MLVCPVCRKKLNKNERSFFCENKHVFDIAKEGYVNLLTGKHKAGELIGDNRDMARARREFLQSGEYDFLAEEICKHIKKSDSVVDICCGEGYYTDYFRRNTLARVYGFDISKEMIKPAAKKYSECTFFVANIADIPAENSSVDAAVEICAPFNEKEFARILKKDGFLLSVVPAKLHLWGLKTALYDVPYENNEDKTEYEMLKKTGSITVKKNSVIRGNNQIMNLFSMTPYYYKTSEKDKKKLLDLNELETQLEFEIRIFERR